MYNSYVRGTLLYSSECWELRQEGKKRLECSEWAMLLWMCNIKKEQCISENSLLRGVEQSPKEIKKFIEKKNIPADVVQAYGFRIQAYDSIMCGYFCYWKR